VTVFKKNGEIDRLGNNYRNRGQLDTPLDDLAAPEAVAAFFYRAIDGYQALADGFAKLSSGDGWILQGQELIETNPRAAIANDMRKPLTRSQIRKKLPQWFY